MSLIPKEDALKIKNKIIKIGEDPRLVGAKKIKGTNRMESKGGKL